VTGPAGFRIDWELGRSVPYPFKQELGLIPGRYTVQAESEKGHGGRTEFQVEAESASPQTVRVSLK